MSAFHEQFHKKFVWDTGESKFHYVIGDQRYNVLFSSTLIDMDGRIHYGSPWGRVRLTPTIR